MPTPSDSAPALQSLPEDIGPGDHGEDQGGVRTTTTDALLGLLSLGPMTGYELRQLIDRSIGNFWSESFGQIYPALRRMVAEGLVEMEKPDREPSTRKLYRLTDNGRDRLLHWLVAPPRNQVPRNELLLKVFFGFQHGPQRTARHVKRFLEEQRRLLVRYSAIQQAMETTDRDDPRMPYWRLTVRYGMHQTEALIRWAEDSVDELQELAPDRAPEKSEP
jgi:PadR family transcriptional regulator, regulatory protein AphA